MGSIRLGEDVFDADLNRLLNVELIAIEKVTGLTSRTLGEGLNDGSAVAMTAFVWVHQKRRNPTLRYEDVQFAMGDIEPVPDEEPEGSDPKDD